MINKKKFFIVHMSLKTSYVFIVLIFLIFILEIYLFFFIKGSKFSNKFLFIKEYMG